jgi:NADH-quinone oxidoreductase subunit L
MAIAVIGGLVGIGVAFSKYIKQNQVPAADAERSTFCKGVYNKYYVDEAYDTIFVKTTNGLSRFFRDQVDYIIISSFGFGKVTNEMVIKEKKQTGSIGFYLCICLGLCAILTYLFIAQ